MKFKFHYSAGTLILVNLFPILGIALFDWNLFSILLLYWLENMVIGFYNILRIYLSEKKSAPNNISGTRKPMLDWSNKNLVVLFFVLHYSAFILAHWFFIWMFFGPLIQPKEILYQSFATLSLGFMAFLISHGYSFFTNFMGNEECKRAPIDQLFIRPYTRVIIMHIAVVFGSWIVVLFGTPFYLVISLIFLKTFLDLSAHLKEHIAFGPTKKS